MLDGMLCTEVSSKLFYSLTIMFFLANPLNKASKLLIIFIHVRKGHTHFQLKGISYSWKSTRPAPMFFSY